MSRFEYLSVLVSIVIGLGISEITISRWRALQLRERSTSSWLHRFWSSFWNVRHVDPWTFPTLFVRFVAPDVQR